MDQNSLVDVPKDLVDAGCRFLGEFAKSYPIAIAFWRKDRHEHDWSLHVASPKITVENMRDAYGEVHRLAQGMKDVHFDPFLLRLERMDDPYVQFAMEYTRPLPAQIATVFHVPTFRGLDVEGMHIYPPIKTPAA
jgi:hypothetical protein